ncbi:MAG: hypothetical protein U0228_15115 [Myxococcaceae bacterium]
MKRTLLFFAVGFLSGCAAAGGAVANAAINTAVAGGVSAVRRANGDCYTVCNPGTACNRSTGMCDPIPCRGECAPTEKCEVTYVGEKCVPAKDVPGLTPTKP